MAIVKKRKLSGSTDGMAIKLTTIVSASASTIHTSTSASIDGSYDEIWLWAYNSHTTNVFLTIEFGDSTSPDHIITFNVPSNQYGPIPIVPGFILQNSKTVKAFAGLANYVTIYGFVNTILD